MLLISFQLVLVYLFLIGPNNGSVSSDVVNNEIVVDTPFVESSTVRPGATITRSGRAFKPVQRFDTSCF